MKSKLLLLLSLLIPLCMLAQTGEPPEDNNLGPALLIIAFIVFMGMFAITLMMFVLLLIIGAIAAFLVFCGLMSVSVLTGIYQRSFTKGALHFMSGFFTLAGCIVGTTVGLLMKAILHFELSSGIVLLIGLIAGGIVGWLIAKTLVKTGRLLLCKMIAA